MSGDLHFLAGGGEMGKLVRHHDWAATPFGSPEGWPQSLRTVVSIMLNTKGLGTILWGPDLRLIYNDLYAETLAERHPAALGRPMMEVWGATTAPLLPTFLRVLETGEGEHLDLLDLPFFRGGEWVTTWWDATCSPIRGEDGSIVGLFNLALETTAQVEADRGRSDAEAETKRLIETLAERETFLSGVLEASTDCIKVLDLDGRLTFMSEGGKRVMEVSDFNAIAGCPWPDFWRDAGNAEAIAAIEGARRGESRSFIGRASTMRGTSKWWHVAVSPIMGGDGKPDRILSVSRDISDLRASEEERDRFVRLVENSTDFVGMARLDGSVFFLNDAARHMVGLDVVDAAALAIADFFGPQEAATVAGEVLPTVERDGQWEGELDFRHFVTGELIPTLCSVIAIKDADNAVVGYGTVTRDFRDRKRAENDMRLMNGELAHRLKNILAVIQSVAQQTLRNAPDTESASERLSARLAALGSATDVLTGKSWRSADLHDLIEGALSPHGTIGERILIDGPTVTLKPEIAVAFTLALHELATNACKYGALSNDTGQVLFDWTVEGEGDDARLSLCWKEQGGPEVSLPKRKGFGSSLIERSLRSYFRGQAATDYRPEGLVFQLDARLGDAAVVAGN